MRYIYIVGFKNAKSNKIFTLKRSIFNSQRRKYVEVKGLTDDNRFKLYTAQTASSIYGASSPPVVKIYESHPFFNIGLIAETVYWSDIRTEKALYPIIKLLKRDLFRIL